MAETLGSLVDKLAIKELRLSALEAGGGKIEGVKEKLGIVKKQRDELVEEIDYFIMKAAKGMVGIKDLKVKLYNKPLKRKKEKGGIGRLVSLLAAVNRKLWCLEDEARKTGTADSHIAAVKRQIDVANQERNDLMDEIDTALERLLKAKKT